MGQITVFSGPERRRRWSNEERQRILTEAFSPGACVAEVCRRHDVSTALIYTWRRKLLEANTGPASVDLSEPGFAEAMVVEDGRPGGSGTCPAMIIDLARGQRVTIFGLASPAQVAAALKTLR
jgi:transposase